MVALDASSVGTKRHVYHAVDGSSQSGNKLKNDNTIYTKMPVSSPSIIQYMFHEDWQITSSYKVSHDRHSLVENDPCDGFVTERCRQRSLVSIELFWFKR